MSRKTIIPEVVLLVLLFIVSLGGVLSLNFTGYYSTVNQFGDSVRLYGHGIYANDSYFKAPIFIGTDFNTLFIGIPYISYIVYKYKKRGDTLYSLGLFSTIACVTYLGASLAFGVKYNRFFLLYIAIFSISLFRIFFLKRDIKLDKVFIPTKGLKVFLIFSSLSTFIAWLPDIIPSIMNNSSLSLIEVYTSEVTYVLDMGIISPLCIITLFLLDKGEKVGTLLLSFILKICISIGIIMVPQGIVQYMSGADLPLEVMITKSFIFILLSSIALYFNIKLYKLYED